MKNRLETCYESFYTKYKHLIKNKYMKRRYILLVSTAVLCSSVMVLAARPLLHAQEYNLQQTIVGDPIVPPDPVDVCPNIPGAQATVPAGMQHDGSGNCYTPTPPPEPVDLCINISDAQAVLPAGYYRTAAGYCYEQPTEPTPPIDVCLNLPDTQATVPEGYYLETDGNCLKPVVPEKDECFNIPGPQAAIPAGMQRDTNQNCYTPEPIASPTNSSHETQGSVTYKNVPEALAPVVASLVNLVPQETKQWLRSLPETVAKTTPYYIFIILGLLALIPLLQSIREALFVRQLKIILKKERDIAEEKDNFITLASHYLRTPLTLMKNGLDTIVALKELPEVDMKPLASTLSNLGVDIDKALQYIENNKTLKGIAPPLFSEDNLSIWRSKFFWGPIIGSVILTLLANFLFGVVGDKEIGGVNMFLQLIIAGVAIIALYSALRNYHIQKRLRAQNEQLLAHEQIVDQARNQFIEEATVTLRDGLDAIDTTKAAIAAAPSARFFEEGYDRFKAILEKFLLLSQVQTGTTRSLETFSLKEEIDLVLAKYTDLIAEKKITLYNETPETTVHQNRLLFNFVISSLIDNAIKFNKEGGAITLTAEPLSKTLKIAVKDNGIGIADDKLDQLFKPFSRATSSVEFNYEGLGFSLFLDKIIMDYTGGAIHATSSPTEGTNIVVSTPLRANT